MLGKQDFLFDKRLVERFIKRGSLSRKDYESHLSTLPDVADRGERIGSDDEANEPEGQSAE